MTHSDDNAPRFYGRRKGRALSTAQAAAVDALLPTLGIPADRLKTPRSLNPRTLFAGPVDRLALEIGFGNGGHLARKMEQEPTTGFIGAEPFLNGLAYFLRSIEDRPHANVRVWGDDAAILLDAIEDCALDDVYLLNPDPWPKTRHHKRRFIRPENLDRLARVLRPGGRLTMTTDVAELAGWMAEHAANHPAFRWTAESARDWREPPPGWSATRYEQKGRDAGRSQFYLIFERTGETA